MMQRLLFPVIWCIFFFPVSSYGLDYYVNGATGSDSATCGQTPTAPCKTIKQALNNIPDGEVTIKIARGTYVEDHLGIWGVNAPDVRNVVFEAGWNSDFSSHSCNTSGTTIVPGDTSNSGWPVLFHLSVSGANNQAAMTVRCMAIQNIQSGDIFKAISVGAEQQGQASLTVEQIQLAGFTEYEHIYLAAKDGGVIDGNIEHSVITNNHGKAALKVYCDNGHIILAMKKNLILNNGQLSDFYHTLDFSCYSGVINIFLENNIIAGNLSSESGSGLYLLSAGNPGTQGEIFFQSKNDTITGNNNLAGSTINLRTYARGSIQFDMSNSILSDNFSSGSFSPDLSLYENSETLIVNMDYCIIGEYAIETGTPTYSSTHEIDGDPALDPAYHLISGSPAKDAGICGYLTGGGPIYQYHRVAPYDDIDGDKRPGWGKLMGCDVGADEYRFPWILFNPATRGTRRP